MNKESIKSKRAMEELEMYMTEGLANYFDSVGGKPLVGRIWGLLSSAPGPVSLSDIARKLNVSKPAVSNTINQVVSSLDLFQKVYMPDYPRESFYTSNFVSLDYLYKASEKKIQSFRKILEKAIEIIDKNREAVQEHEGLRKVSDNIHKTKILFEFISDEYSNFLEKISQKIKLLEKSGEIL